MSHADELLRVYFPDDVREHLGIGDNYPVPWKQPTWWVELQNGEKYVTERQPREEDRLRIHDDPTRLLHSEQLPTIKDYVRQLTGYRCQRCLHPYPPGIAKEHPRGEWTPCDNQCTHGGTTRSRIDGHGDETWLSQWRILTVHHLNGVKYDCRWHNLVPLCQRCHLTIQGRVIMSRVYPFEHSDWFKPYAAAYYASVYEGVELTREETMARLDELLAYERQV